MIVAVISTSKKNCTKHNSYVDRPWTVFSKPISKNSLARRKLTHVSLFSGCGGFDLGFHQAGFKTVFANDIDANACETYEQNIGTILNADIREIDIPIFNYRVDVLTAGFPCQPFSNAGSRRGIKDDRGKLYTRAIDFVRKIKPRCVIFENVRGLMSVKLEDGNLLIGDICKQLDKLGYNVVFSLIDSSHYNVPQKRLRVLIVGTEKNYKGNFSFPEPVSRNDLSLKDTILDIKGNEHNQNELMQLGPQASYIGSMIPEGGSWKDVAYDKLPPRLQRIRNNIKRYRNPKFYRRFHRDEIMGTVTAAFMPENAGVWHPVEKRIFSVREVARIQSFPDWFKFEGANIKSKYQQIGNAVPPRLAYEIALQIKRVLSGKKLHNANDPITFNEFLKTGKTLKASDKSVLFTKIFLEEKRFLKNIN